MLYIRACRNSLGAILFAEGKFCSSKSSNPAGSCYEGKRSDKSILRCLSRMAKSWSKVLMGNEIRKPRANKHLYLRWEIPKEACPGHYPYFLLSSFHDVGIVVPSIAGGEVVDPAFVYYILEGFFSSYLYISQTSQTFLYFLIGFFFLLVE